MHELINQRFNFNHSFLKDTGGDENFQLYGVNIGVTAQKGLTVFEKVRTELIDDKTAMVVFDPATAKEKEILFEIEI